MQNGLLTERLRLENRLLFATEGVWSEVADMYSACLIGSWAVAMMGVRTRL